VKLQVLGSAPPEHIAAITAAIAVVEAEQVAAARAAAASSSSRHPEQLSAWVEASRRSAQRALLQRGPWRLSGRLGRRSRT
jgi:hypothetical protein